MQIMTSPRTAFSSKSGGVSSTLISQLAVLALKLRLKAQTDVTCDVTSRSADLLLRGRVGPVTVKGKGWQSGLGLTCRAIEATVDSCELDVPRLLSDQKLRLLQPAVGKAMVALNAHDFSNFITHPLMKTLGDLQFVREGTSIDATSGTVTFHVLKASQTFRCVLQRADNEQRRARIEVQGDDIDTALEISQSLSDFFNDLVFELDGTFLSFRDMMVTGKGGAPSVMLALSIKVHKFPSAGLQF
ncbi:hypothetical protein FisN_3Lh564 [Fistulifera solaris]|uniref:Uncharacterized protein n=1 Tax=Fistulifera solaris TaxID=1519565 RepID=A0A1Z5J8N2_FISSO|nr:hypothetical protein FisN_3Lh564 [Fistulifera solaris]|eukprot:GAX10354.1 hypothetical protein FisN_3Lh564 [Fistulifera solaris]